MKSDNSNNILPISIIFNGKVIHGLQNVCDAFNIFFSSLSPCIQASASESECFISNHFKKLSDSSTLSPKTFSFRSVSLQNIQDLLRNLDSHSSMGATGIPPSIFKDADLCSIVTLIFNSCMTSNIIPKDWKTAIVTPLYKNKGDLNDINNYRAFAIQ